MKKGKFIVLDGLGGSGKSTQLELLRRALPARTVFTHEPGGSPRAERIRSMLKEEDGDDALFDFFMFWAARAEHIHKLIAPALKEGKTVISDRFDSSTFAMQVRGEGKKKLEKFFWQCREAVVKEFEPDLYIILDAGPGVARARKEGRREGEDRFDERAELFQTRTRAGYREFARAVKKAVVIDSRSDVDTVFEKIKAELKMIGVEI